MSDVSTRHGDFSIERQYDFAPAIVFAAWADPAAKFPWFAGADGFGEIAYSMDFRVGGHETASGVGPHGKAFTNDTVIHDIVENARIVFSYRMTLDGAPISVSLTTVTLEAHRGGTRLTYAEQGVFLDGYDGLAGREEGCGWLLARLDEYLEQVAALPGGAH